MLNQFDQLLRNGDYLLLYEKINNKITIYSLENICKYFKKINSKDLFIYLTFAISKSETIDKYITICDALEYLDQFIDDNYSLIRWYVYKAIDSFENSIEMKKWAVETYYTSPCSPFKTAELLSYAKDIIISDEKHKASLELIDKHKEKI